MHRTHVTTVLALSLLSMTLDVPARAAVLRVRSYNPGPVQDGTTWANAFMSIQAALDAAREGDEVWVAQGTYRGIMTAKSAVALYGGFVGTETVREERTPQRFETVLDGDRLGSVVTIPEGAAAGTVVDSFTIRNGAGTFVPIEPQSTLGTYWGGGIYSRDASPTISNNRIIANAAGYPHSGVSQFVPGYGGGLYCEGGAPVIRDNVINGNRAWKGSAIDCRKANLTLVGNTISDNHSAPRFFDNVSYIDARLYGGAVLCSEVTGVISENTVSDNSLTADQADGWISGFGGGIVCMESTMTVARNRITGNRLSVAIEDNSRAAGAGLYGRDSHLLVSGNLIAGNEARAYAFHPTTQGAGIAVQGGTILLVNNTIVDNAAAESAMFSGTSDGGGIYLEGVSDGSLVTNNIVAGNTSGLWTDSALPLRHNDLHGNTDYDVRGIEDPNGQNGNISSDPLFVDRGNGNFHLLPGSPALDAGDDSAVIGTHDLSGGPRTLGAHVDMGAYELDASRPHIWHVKAGTTGTADGTSWETAFATLPAALDAARPGDQVWVAQGTYTEAVRMDTPDVGLYGGFAGTETDREMRDPKAYVTTIGPSPATRYDKRVAVAAGVTGFLVDGFTIREGYAGVYCEAGASGMISNNVIAQNGLGEAAEAGGIYAGTASSLIITGNVILGNSCGSGAGIVAEDARLEVARNVISDNLAFIDVGAPVLGGGILCAGGSAVIHDNLFVGNRATADVWLPILYPQPEARGGAIAGWNADLTIVNNTFVDNVAGLTSRSYNGAAEGGAVYIGHGSAHIRNNILTGNRAGVPTQNSTLGSGDVAFSEDAQVTFRTNLLFDNVPATTPVPEGNIAADPLFVDATNGDYRPRPGSPAINTGDDGSIHGSTDLDGLPRFVAPHVDLGAYENQAPPPFSIPDVALALRIAGGLHTASGSTARYNVVTDGGSATRIDLLDAASLARKAAGLDANP